MWRVGGDTQVIPVIPTRAADGILQRSCSHVVGPCVYRSRTASPSTAGQFLLPLILGGYADHTSEWNVAGGTLWPWILPTLCPDAHPWIPATCHGVVQTTQRSHLFRTITCNFPDSKQFAQPVLPKRCCTLSHQ